MRKAPRGFTLIEVMIVVAMVAILAAIAIPSYQNYIRKTRRTDAKNALLDLATREEKFYSINNKYSTTASDLGYSAFPYAVNSTGNSYYNLSVGFKGTDTGTFQAKATPTGAQLNDKDCYEFTIDNTGLRGNNSNTLPTDKCW